MSVRLARTAKAMKVAIQGCCHGTLDKIYDHIAQLEHQNNYKVDLLLICGDFQAIRNHSDLQCMAVPQKYRELGGFHRYYLKQKTAPILTLVIGGNHEASNYMWELYHGGWLAPNIYFLGFSGCVRVNGVRIAGISGIYNKSHYSFGYNERVPYDKSTIRSIYHTRQYEICKLSQLTLPDIFLSHDWPNTIEKHGNTADLLRRKPYFTQETETGTLGSPPLLDLLKALKPQYWFSAHLHTRFEASYKHSTSSSRTRNMENPEEIIIVESDMDDVANDVKAKTASVQNPDEIRMDDEDDPQEIVSFEKSKVQATETSLEEAAVSPENRETYFLALDKCLPKRNFLEVIDIPTPSGHQSESPAKLTYDSEWLAICRALHPFLTTERSQSALPRPEEARKLSAIELDWVRENLPEGGLQAITDVQTFIPTAPGPNQANKNQRPQWYTNPQTEAFVEMLHVPNKVNPRRFIDRVVPSTIQPNIEPSKSELDMPQSRGNDQVTPTEDSSDPIGDGTTTPQDISTGRWSPSRVAD